MTLDRRQQPDLDVPPPPAQRENPIGRRLLAADGIHRDMTAAAGQVVNGSGDVPVGEDRVRATPRTRRMSPRE